MPDGKSGLYAEKGRGFGRDSFRRSMLLGEILIKGKGRVPCQAEKATAYHFHHWYVMDTYDILNVRLFSLMTKDPSQFSLTRYSMLRF